MVQVTETTGIKRKRRRKKLVVLSLFLMLCLFLWQAPPRLFSVLNRDVWGDQIDQKKQQTYHGVITLWHIDNFEGGKGSRTAWLNARLSAIERRNEGIFVAVKTMTPEKAKAALASGSTLPDLISYGSGMFENTELFMQLPQELLAAVPPKMAAAGTGYALPWCYGAYCILADQALVAKHADGALNAETLPLLLSKLGGVTKYGKTTRDVFALGIPENGLVPSAAAAKLLAGGAAGSEFSLRAKGSSETLWEAYNYSKEICMLLGTQRDLCRLETAASREKARASLMLPLPGYTDLVQCISVLKNNNEKELKIIYAVLEYLLSTDVQASLTDIGMFPASLAAAENAHYENEMLDTLFHAVRQSDPVIPTVFMGMKERASDREALIQYLISGKNQEALLKYSDKTG